LRLLEVPRRRASRSAPAPARGAQRLAAAALLPLALGVSAGCAPEALHPDVVLIAVDTLRADHSSVHGYERDTTPQLEALAREGTRFEVAYSPMSITGAAIASLFTGLHPAGHLVLDNGIALSDAQESLAEMFRASGYQTAAIVSSFVLDAKFGFGQGFDHYDDDFDAESASFVMEKWQGRERVAAFDRRADQTTDAAIRWLEAGRDRGRPCFLFVHYFDPHAPYLPPGAAALRFTAPRGSEPLASQVARYDSEIAFADAQIGRLLAALSAVGLDRTSIVVATSDHGEGLMQRNYMTHGLFVYEEEVRVPLVVRWPDRVAAGRVVTAPVALVDLAPTLVDLTGIELPRRRFDGASLAAGLLGEADFDETRAVFLQRKYFRGGLAEGKIPAIGRRFAVRQGGWKYIFGPAEGTHELYDLAQDPGETTNRFHEVPELAERLREQVERWRSAHPVALSRAEISAQDREALRALGYGD